MKEEKRDDQQTARARENPQLSTGAWWRLPLLLAVVLTAIIAARNSHTRTRGPNSPTARQPQPAADAAGKTVSLTIRFGDGKERKFEGMAWHQGMTVDDLMSAVSRKPNSISYSVFDVRERMLLAQIDDESNDSDEGKFWTYAVNDKLADRSLGVYELQPGDRVLWTFGSKQ